MNPNLNSPPRLPESERPPCFGRLFPDFSQLTYNRTAEGCAFDARVESCGVSVQRKALTFKPQRWGVCASPGVFDECYRLSLAKLLLETKLDRYT